MTLTLTIGCSRRQSCVHFLLNFKIELRGGGEGAAFLSFEARIVGPALGGPSDPGSDPKPSGPFLTPTPVTKELGS